MTFLHQLFELRKCGPERGDCTAAYEVIFDRANQHPTVKQFLKDVIARNGDWGRIIISPDQSYKTEWDLISYHGEVDALGYHWGEWGKDYDIFVEKYGDRKIKSATADGGWSLMDYVLLLEDDMKYKAFDNIDIPTDFETTIANTRHHIERMYDDKLLTDSEYNSIMTTIDGSEARALSHVRKLTNGETY